MLREGEDVCTVFDSHISGFFSRAQWLRICRKAGFDPEIKRYRLSEPEGEHEAFLCMKSG